MSILAGCVGVADEGSDTEEGVEGSQGEAVKGAPRAPAGLAAVAISSSEVSLSWTDRSNNETSFSIERSLKSTGPFDVVGHAPASVAEFGDKGLSAGTKYYYRVRAVNAAGSSAYSPAAVTTNAASGPVCGNGIVEAGESCDKNCPSSCDDADPSTADAMVGSAAQCNAACTHEPITACVSGDAFCPAACTHASDSDCADSVSGYPAGPYGNKMGETLANITFRGYFAPNATAGLASSNPFGEVTLEQVRASGAKYMLALASPYAGEDFSCLGGTQDAMAIAAAGAPLVAKGALFFDEIYGQYSTQAQLDAWIAHNGQYYSTVETMGWGKPSLDATFRYAFASLIIVDLETMKILEVISNHPTKNGEPRIPPGPQDGKQTITLQMPGVDHPVNYVLPLVNRALGDLSLLLDGATPVCGDGKCNLSETPSNCESDCSIPAACDTSAWPAASTALENDVLALVNQRRAAGGTCVKDGVSTSYPPSAPLTLNAKLQQAARCHSKGMADWSFFDHTSLNGSSAADRLIEVGYNFTAMGENIAAGPKTAAEVVDSWMTSTKGHCDNILGSSFADIGIGYASNYQAEYFSRWTQDFGHQ